MEDITQLKQRIADIELELLTIKSETVRDTLQSKLEEFGRKLRNSEFIVNQHNEYATDIIQAYNAWASTVGVDPIDDIVWHDDLWWWQSTGEHSVVIIQDIDLFCVAEGYMFLTEKRVRVQSGQFVEIVKRLRNERSKQGEAQP